MYELFLLIGVMGYAALMLMGMTHGHAGAARGGHGGHHGAHGHGHGPGHHGGSTAKGGFKGRAGGKSLGNLITFSPLDIFSLALGAGLTGLALRQYLSPVLVGIAAGVGALVFTVLLVKPLTNFILRFASTPSEGLEGMVAKYARAESNFDARGRGTVTVEIDGQLSRLLAQLPPSEIGHRIGRGDELLIVEVLADQGKCIVSHELLDEINLTTLPL